MIDRVRNSTIFGSKVVGNNGNIILRDQQENCEYFQSGHHQTRV